MILRIRRLAQLTSFFVLLAGTPTGLVWSAEPSKPVKPDFARAAEIVERAIKDRIFPGCSVAIGNHQGVLFARGFGRLDYEGGAEVTPQTLYDLASVTKIVGTTSVVVTLVRDGKLSVTDPVSKYVPEFLTAAKDETDKQRRAKVTLEHLLTHSAGLPAWEPLYKKADGYDSMLKLVIATPLEVEPGTRTAYSDLGVMLLGEIAARIGGKRLTELEQERIFTPLGLHDTLRNPPTSLLTRIAPTESRGEGKGFWQGVVHDENARAGEGLTAHAGLFSTADDMALWSQEWLKGTRGESQIFPQKLVEQFTRRREIVAGSSRALGWDTPPGSAAGKKLSSHAFGHTGFTGTSVWIDPDADLYIVLLTNAVHPKRGDLRIQKVRRDLSDAAIDAVQRLR